MSANSSGLPYTGLQNAHSNDTAKNLVKVGRIITKDIPVFPIPVNKALSPSVELSLTIAYIVLYGLLFFMVYVQLWMIWYYRHKRFSYQTVFLFLCLVWSGLRLTLFSFYFNDCDRANNLPGVIYWFLYCFPVCLQFIILCLLVLFFAQVVFKARAKYEPSRYKRPVRIIVCIAAVIFLGSNIGCAVVVKYHESHYQSVPIQLLYIRVAINDSLFVIFAIFLSVCIYKMTKMSSSALVLEAKGTTMCQSISAGLIITLLFTSRAIYNFIAVYPKDTSRIPGFGYDWVNVSDQADAYNLSGSYAYISFGAVLFVWEVLPTFVVVMFFRVRRAINDTSLADSTHSHTSKVFFFDNPRRYDSDDDLSRPEHLPGSPFDINNQYSVNSTNSRGTPRGTPIMNAAGTPRTGYGAVLNNSLTRNEAATIHHITSNYTNHHDDT
ncbi:hypothetical protein SNE40_009123 [Patella caerulea]|uniref:Integral membrane protein GPR137B n=2 Tax=Patella caerulea TaxID=87958 RepID=A0AAN8JTE5_PATCE